MKKHILKTLSSFYITLLFSCNSQQLENKAESANDGMNSSRISNIDSGSDKNTQLTTSSKTSVSTTSIKDSSIIGSWVSEEDSLYKIVFTADKCYDYYEGVISDSSTYVISNSSPQCGQNVPVENYTSYLQLTSLKDGEKTCYEINGITSQTLSLRELDQGEPSVYKRQ
jgi:hypothetical protein